MREARLAFSDRVHYQRHKKYKCMRPTPFAPCCAPLCRRSKNLMSAELYGALIEAVQAVENATNSTVTLDGSSPAYKEFAKRVEVGGGRGCCGLAGRCFSGSLSAGGMGRGQWRTAGMVTGVLQGGARPCTTVLVTPC